MSSLFTNLSDDRRVGIIGYIDDDSIKEPMARIQALWLESRIKPVLIEFDSKGGAIDAACRLYKQVKWLGKLAHGIVKGHCDSAAVLILRGCHVRSCRENARFDLHSPWTDPMSPASQAMRAEYGDPAVDGMEALRRQRYIYCLAEALRLSPINVIEILRQGDPPHSRCMDVAEAQRRGIVNQILSG